MEIAGQRLRGWRAELRAEVQREGADALAMSALGLVLSLLALLLLVCGEPRPAALPALAALALLPFAWRQIDYWRRLRTMESNAAPRP